MGSREASTNINGSFLVEAQGSSSPIAGDGRSSVAGRVLSSARRLSRKISSLGQDDLLQAHNLAARSLAAKHLPVVPSANSRGNLAQDHVELNMVKTRW